MTQSGRWAWAKNLLFVSGVSLCGAGTNLIDSDSCFWFLVSTGAFHKIPFRRHFQFASHLMYHFLNGWTGMKTSIAIPTKFSTPPPIEIGSIYTGFSWSRSRLVEHQFDCFTRRRIENKIVEFKNLFNIDLEMLFNIETETFGANFCATPLKEKGSYSSSRNASVDFEVIIVFS